MPKPDRQKWWGTNRSSVVTLNGGVGPPLSVRHARITSVQSTGMEPMRKRHRSQLQVEPSLSFAGERIGRGHVKRNETSTFCFFLTWGLKRVNEEPGK